MLNEALFTISAPLITLSPLAPSPAIRVFFAGVGETLLNISVVGKDLDIDALYSGARTLVPLFGVPGLTVAPVNVSIQPFGSATILLSPDTPPTLKTYVTIANSDGSLIAAPTSVLLPARAIAARSLVVSHRAPGTATLSLSASSPGMLAQLSVGCESADARACATLFASRGCAFNGYEGSSTPGAATWRAEMRNISLQTGVIDCSVHERCLRVACCGAPTAVQCAQAAVTSRGCSVDAMVPPLSDVENSTADWGILPLSVTSQLAHYESWVPGVSCLPFVPCAWDRCFPGGGNFDGAVSDNVIITALPGPLPFFCSHQDARLASTRSTPHWIFHFHFLATCLSPWLPLHCALTLLCWTPSLQHSATPSFLSFALAWPDSVHVCGCICLCVLLCAGFIVSPRSINLQQGDVGTLFISLDTPQTVPVNVSLSLVKQDGQPLPSAVASLSHQSLFFPAGSSAPLPVRVWWEGAGRADLMFDCSSASGGYATVRYSISNIVSASPGFSFSLLSATRDSAETPPGRLEASAGGIEALLPARTNMTLAVTPLWRLSRALNLAVATSDPAVVTAMPSSLAFPSPSSDALMTALPLSLSAHASGLARVHLFPFAGAASNASASMAPLQLSPGMGYTAGTLSLSGYGGSGFSGSYAVGIISWSFYSAQDGSELRGSNLTDALSGSGNFSFEGKTARLSYGACRVQAAPIMVTVGNASSPRITGHTGGRVVAGCQPSVTITVQRGRVQNMAFHGRECLATGITCEVSIPAVGKLAYLPLCQDGCPHMAPCPCLDFDLLQRVVLIFCRLLLYSSKCVDMSILDE